MQCGKAREVDKEERGNCGERKGEGVRHRGWRDVLMLRKKRKRDREREIELNRGGERGGRVEE